MTDRVIFKKSLGKPGARGKQTWFDLGSGGVKGYMVVCPQGHLITLLDYVIKPSGIVEPWVQCKKCSFFKPIKLEDYPWRPPTSLGQSWDGIGKPGGS